MASIEIYIQYCDNFQDDNHDDFLNITFYPSCILPDIFEHVYMITNFNLPVTNYINKYNIQ